MIKINNENIKELNYGKEYNDYPYILLYCVLKDENYKQWAISELNNLKQGEICIVDNSCYEFIKNKETCTLTIEDYIQIMNNLVKNCPYPEQVYFIIPDGWNNRIQTIKNVQEFNSKGPSSLRKWKTMGVIHGETLQEMVLCHNDIVNEVDYIGIPHESLAYKGNRSKTNNCVKGRKKLIHTLYKNNLISKPLHLLGIMNPIEFKNKFYKHAVNSVDTSYPVTTALDNIPWNALNLNHRAKPKMLLCNILNTSITEEQKQQIITNIKEFRKVVNNE